MANDKLRVLFELLADDKVTGPLKNISKEATKSQKSVRTIGTSFGFLGTAAKGFGSVVRGITSAVFSLQGAFVAAVGAFTISRLIDESNELKNSLIGLQSVAGALGQDVDFVTESAKDLASDGLIPLSDAASALKNLLATGLDAQQSIELFKSLRDSAAFNRQGQLTLGEAVSRAAEGIKNQNSTLVDNAGITKNLSIIYKEYADSLGISVAQLSEAQKAQAAFTGITKEATLFQGDYNRLLDTFSGASSKATGNLKFLLAELGNIITENPVVISLTNKLGESLGKFRDVVKENSTSIQLFITNGLARILEIVPKVIKFFQGFVKVLAGVAKIAALATAGFLELFNILLEFNLVKGIFDALSLGLSKILFSIAVLIDELLKLGGTKVLEALGIDTEGLSDRVDDLKVRAAGIADSFKADDATSALKGIQNGTFGLIDSINSAENSSNVFLDSVAQGSLNAKDTVEELVKTIGKVPKETKVKANVEIERELTLKDAISAADKELSSFVGNFGKSGAKALTGIFSSLRSGAQGAVNLFSGLIEGAVTQLGGDLLGPIAGEVFSLLAQGPAAVKEQIDSFTAAIPQIFENVITAIPTFLEALIVGVVEAIVRIADRIDIIIIALVEGLIRALPRIVGALATLMPRVSIALAKSMPLVAIALAKEAVRQFSNPLGLFKETLKAAGLGFASDILKGAEEFVKKLLESVGGTFGIGGGGGGGGILEPIGDFFGFQRGGIVPQGFPNDSFPAALTSGEAVIPTNLTNRLDRFLDQQDDGVQNTTNILLTQIAGLLNQPMQVESSVEVNNREFANIILELSRTNARLTI